MKKATYLHLLLTFIKYQFTIFVTYLKKINKSSSYLILNIKT